MEEYAAKNCHLLACPPTSTQDSSKTPRSKCAELLSDTYLEKPQPHDETNIGCDDEEETPAAKRRKSGRARGPKPKAGSSSSSKAAADDTFTAAYECETCSKPARTRKELREHVYYHHTPKRCTWCDLEFPGAYLYYYHNNKVHFEVSKCDVCGQTFKGREKLRIHKINKHMKDSEKPYVCGVCGKGKHMTTPIH